MTDPATPDPRDRANEGLQDARDESDPGPDEYADVYSDWPPSQWWRTRYDTREEWEESR